MAPNFGAKSATLAYISIIHHSGISSRKQPQNVYNWAGIALLTSPTGFLLVAMSDHTTGSRNIKPEVVFKVQKMARYASQRARLRGECLSCQIGPLGLGLGYFYDWGSTVGHPSNIWASC